MVYKDGKQLNPAKRLQLYNALHYPATKSSAFVLGQRSGDLNLKRGLDSYYKAFQGYLSGMYLWERALSSEEIAQVHQKNTPMDNLVVRWNDFANIRRSGSIRLFTFRKLFHIIPQLRLHNCSISRPSYRVNPIIGSPPPYGPINFVMQLYFYNHSLESSKV